jgi:hypothetical protein
MPIINESTDQFEEGTLERLQEGPRKLVFRDARVLLLDLPQNSIAELVIDPVVGELFLHATIQLSAVLTEIDDLSMQPYQLRVMGDTSDRASLTAHSTHTFTPCESVDTILILS